MSPSALASGGRQKTWTRDKIIDALRRYAAMYGPDFTASAFSPSTAKWRDEPRMADRYFAGDAAGNPWPSLNAIKAPFDGSFNAAREAAGLSANKPGPSRGRRKAGEHAPIRDVRHVTRTVTREVDGGEARRRADRAERKVEALRKRVERLEARLAERPKAITKTKVEKVRDGAGIARAEARAAKALERVETRLAEAREAEKLARVDMAEARQAASRAASKLERAEATIHELRDERRDLRAELSRAVDRAAAAERERDVARARMPERVVIREESPEAAVVRDAEHRADRAEREAHEAELRAARAEREYLELAAVVKGEPRKLSKAELDGLRARGPAGPAVLAKALSALAAARKSNNKTALYAALTSVMQAAATWRDRL